MAKFSAKVRRPNGKTFDVPAETCKHCKGIGYLTKPIRFESRNAKGEDFHIHYAASGDKCPLCRGRGWIGIVG